MGRIGCILIPDLPIAAMLRSRPELRERPLALAANPAPHAELVAVSPEAAAAGVRVMMTAAQARAIVPGIAIVQRAPQAERAALEAILDAAESVSPMVEPGAPDRAWFALEGLARQFVHSQNRDSERPPSAAGGIEAEIAAELKARAYRLGLDVAVGVGASKEIASLAARCGGIRVIDAGREREFLDWIPLDLLDLDDGLEQTLARWGIRRLGEFGRLDPKAVASRLGAAGLELARMARGERLAPFVPRRRGEEFVEKIELEYGVENLEPLAFLIRPMLERAVARLAMRGLVAGDIALEFGLVDRGRDQRRVTVASAANDVRALLTLVTLSLEASPPAAAVEAIAVGVEARPARPAQSGLFAPPAPAPGRLETTLARLAALCGPERVGILRAADSWRPEATHLTSFAPPPSPNGVAAPPPPAAPGSVTCLAIRAIRPAEEVEVMCDRGAPEFVRGRQIAARVITIAGPWRRAGEWWDGAGTGFARDYYELALGDGAVYRAYRDRHTDRWFVDGIYD